MRFANHVFQTAKGADQGGGGFSVGSLRSKLTGYRHQELFLRIAQSPTESIFDLLHTRNTGLSSDEVKERQLRFGLNEIAHDRVRWQSQLRRALVNPFNILLAVLASVSFATGDIKGTITLAAMVVISVSLTFIQEFRSSRAAESLKKMVQTRATVLRRLGHFHSEQGTEWVNRKAEIPIEEIVPGDVILLSAGDMVPADVRLLNSKDLFVSQSAMTGESVPVEKTANSESASVRDALHLTNICFMGTNVVSGTATAAVIKTGGDTFLGSIAKSVAGVRVQTSFDKGVHRITWLMIRFMLVMAPFVFLVNGVTKGDWTEAFMFAVAVAVGLVPEMLPMIVTVNLAKGAMSMFRKKVIVKRLNSIQNFGAMNMLCTDKTGTLTQDKIVLEKYLDVSGAPNDRVLKYAYLNSYYQTGLKNLLDVAVLNHRELSKELEIDRVYRKLDEIPFDFTRKRMSVVVEKSNGRHILICKGALEEMLKVCGRAEVGNEIVAIPDLPVERFQKIAQDLNDDGLRVVAVAYKDVEAGQRKEYSVIDEGDLILLGYIAFLDPPKESASQAIKKLNEHGVAVKVLTGDNDRVTRKVARDVGLPADDILLGSQIDDLTDEGLDNVVEKTSVFAKLTPAQKERIVRSLHRLHHVVGFLGDGINDAPALKAADVGISVENAVDIAKESADIILLEKSLLVLEEGVIEGRKVFGNIIKYIKMGASSNFGNMFSMLGASALFPFLPMQPVQLLTQNLLYDISQTAIPFDDVDAQYLEKPRKWEIGEIRRFMVFFGPISSLFDYVTFALMWFFFKSQTPATESLFQSGWFVEGLLSQTLIVHMIRTRRIPFIQSRASWPLILMTASVMAVGILVPFSDYGKGIGLEPLPLSYFPWLVLILLCYCVMTQLMKNWFVRKYGYN
ncbi:MAG: magnesium-translocating P-type ATPase [Bdellovibrio sp.]|nr:MAG: magnesium-translocating P-type ATPase [Bdellovibrio sp.]